MGSISFSGLLIGIATFLMIGIFHPIVIKTEYYIGKQIWWVFLLAGILSILGSLFVKNLVLSILLGIFAFSCLWSILELYEQEKRVLKGWFPRNPNRRHPYPDEPSNNKP